AGLPDDPALLDRSDDGLLFCNCPRKRFFSVYVLAAARGFAGHQLMPLIRDGDHHRVDVVARKQFAVVVVTFTIVVLVVVVDGVNALFQVRIVEVADGHNLAIVFAQETVGITGALHAVADNANDNSVGGQRASLRRGGATRQNGWKDNSSGGYFKK